MRIGMRKLLVAGAAVALLAGVGAAVAAAQGGPPPNAPRAGLQPGGMGGGYGLMAGGVVLDAAAVYIGVDEAALVAARHDGDSLSQVATAHGKTVAGLEQALVKAFKANLDEAVSAGRLTEAQAALALERFQAQVSTVVTRTAVGPMNGAGRGMGLGLGPCGRA